METRKLNWQTWLKQGDEFWKSIAPDIKSSRFGTDIQYNLISMSFESYAMAILDYHKTLPDNHTFLDLITALEAVIPINEALKEKILQYENIQSICSIEKYYRENPTIDEVIDLRKAIEEVRMIAYNICLPANQILL